MVEENQHLFMSLLYQELISFTAYNNPMVVHIGTLILQVWKVKESYELTDD